MTETQEPRANARSFLYVPADQPRLFDKAAASGADAIVLDLEDAVPLASKDEARAAVNGWVERRVRDDASSSRPECWVRINAESIDEDTTAVARPGVDGLFLAKCSVSGLERLSDRLDRLESDRDMAAGSIGVIGLLETAASLVAVPEMATHPRLVTVGIGEVDLLADLRMRRTVRTVASVAALRTQVVVQCAVAGLAAPVAPTDTDVTDLEAFAETSRTLLDLGFRSRTAIHPRQVGVIHQVFTPDASEVASARDVVDRFDAAGGGVTVDAAGRLIDAAVVRAAREILSRVERT